MNRTASIDFRTLLKPTTRADWDWLTPFAILGLGIFGIAFIYSAELSDPRVANAALFRQSWFKQIAYLGLGGTLYLVVSLIDYKHWLNAAYWLYFACLTPLFIVLIPGVGGSVADKWGATRWINLGFFNYQPSETAKVAVLLITASILVHSKLGNVRESLRALGILALAMGVPILLCLKQPDLKPAMVLPPMVFSMLYVSKLSPRFFLGALGAFLLLVGVLWVDCARYVQFMDDHRLDYNSKEHSSKFDEHSWLPIHGYQRNRILAYVAPDKVDPKGVGITYNVSQSRISVGSGGLTGKGWTEGTQAQLGYLPRSVAPTDFIFAVIAEEKGFVGSLTVLGLFGIVLFNGIRTAGSARDRFGTLLALGVTVLFMVHVFVNIAMTIGLVPITGIPLPFISYGGSFVLSCCLLQGLVQSVWRFRKDFT